MTNSETLHPLGKALRDSQVGPEALIVKNSKGESIVEKLVNKPCEVAEEMVLQYESKNEEVKNAMKS